MQLFFYLRRLISFYGLFVSIFASRHVSCKNLLIENKTFFLKIHIEKALKIMAYVEISSWLKATLFREFFFIRKIYQKITLQILM